MSNIPSDLNIQISQLTADISQLKEGLASKILLLQALQNAKSRYVDWRKPTCYCQFSNGLDEDFSSDFSDYRSDCRSNCDRDRDCYSTDSNGLKYTTEINACDEDFWRCQNCMTGIKAYCHCDEHWDMVSTCTEDDSDEDNIEVVCTKDQRDSLLAKSKQRDARRFALRQAAREMALPRVTHAAQHLFKIQRKQHKRHRRAGVKRTAREKHEREMC